MLLIEICICMLFVHEIGHCRIGNKFDKSKSMHITGFAHSEPDAWNVFTDKQIQKIAKAGLRYESIHPIKHYKFNLIVIIAHLMVVRIHAIISRNIKAQIHKNKTNTVATNAMQH